MPQPWIERTLVHIPGCSGRYVPMVQETESPKNVILGSAPAVSGRPRRLIGTTRTGVRAVRHRDGAGSGTTVVTMTGAAAGAGSGAGTVASPIMMIMTPN